MTIAFDPTTANTVSANILINNNDLDESFYSFTVTGEGKDVLYNNGFEQIVIPLEPTLNLGSNHSSVISGESITLTWTVANDADVCIKTGDWSGAANPTNGQHSEIVPNLTTNSTYSLQCHNSMSSSFIESVSVIILPTLSLTANPLIANSGGSANLIWNISNNATSCTKSGDWSGVLTGIDVSNGSHSQSIPLTKSISTYSLFCSNAGGSTAIKSVTVNTVPANCAVDQPPILNGAEDTTIIANGTSNAGNYNGLYSDLQGDGSINPWPGNFGENISLSITNNMYISAEFNSGNSIVNGRFLQTIPGNIQGPSSGSRRVSISECPGEFSIHLNQPKCLAFGTLFWSTNPAANPAAYCKLEKNKNYYLNIVDSDNSENNNYSTTDCAFSYCGILATQLEFNF